MFIVEISILLENFNFDTEWGKTKVQKWGNWATLGPKRPQVGAADNWFLKWQVFTTFLRGQSFWLKWGEIFCQ